MLLTAKAFLAPTGALRDRMPCVSVCDFELVLELSKMVPEGPEGSQSFRDSLSKTLRVSLKERELERETETA